MHKTVFSGHNLEMHIKAHAGKRLTNADIEEIVTKFHLNKQCHYAISRAHHSGEKSNKCNQCDFASSRGDVLKTHFKNHSGEKMN